MFCKRILVHYGYYSYSYSNEIYNAFIQRGTSRVQACNLISCSEKMPSEVVVLPSLASPEI